MFWHRPNPQRRHHRSREICAAALFIFASAPACSRAGTPQPPPPSFAAFEALQNRITSQVLEEEIRVEDRRPGQEVRVSLTRVRVYWGRSVGKSRRELVSQQPERRSRPEPLGGPG